MPLHLDARLRERDLGYWSGLTSVEIVARWPADLARLRARDPELQPGGGESLRALHAREVSGDDKIVKISIVGVGMRSHAGIASRMFQALADEGINIQMISTSEIKISVVVDEKYLELGVRTLHQAFGLSQSG